MIKIDIKAQIDKYLGTDKARLSQLALPYLLDKQGYPDNIEEKIIEACAIAQILKEKGEYEKILKQILSHE